MSEQTKILEKLDAMHRDIAEIMKRVNAANTTNSQIAKDVLTVEEFLDELERVGMKRSRDWLYDQIRRRKVRVLPVGKPYRIARSEALKLGL
ncbi:MAG TPA: hypothetical protein VHD62_11190 [Opitutaceae bacterium]|nr:hypothetical protein [Opitutaceae bacterium]